MKIYFFATFRDLTKTKELEIPRQDLNTIQQLLTSLIERFPELQSELFTDNYQLKSHVHIFVNGRNIIHANCLSTLIAENDEIALFPPVAEG